MRILLFLLPLAVIGCSAADPLAPNLKVARGDAEPTDWRCTKASSPTYAHVTSDEKGALIQQGYTCVKNF